MGAVHRLGHSLLRGLLAARAPVAAGSPARRRGRRPQGGPADRWLPYVAAKLRLPDVLRDGPAPVTELACSLGVDPPMLRRVLRAMVAVGLLTEDAEGRFGLAPAGERLLSGAPGSERGEVGPQNRR